MIGPHVHMGPIKNEEYISHDVLLQVSKEFMMSPNKLHLECSLDKELYYHGETISVNVHIQASHMYHLH